MTASASPTVACQQRFVSVTTIGAAPATRAEFVAHVDRCVRALIDARTPHVQPDALQQLLHWLFNDSAHLADGTRIDLALFDASILSIDERMPQRSSVDRAVLLRASRQVAEAVYAQR